ncbi:sulfatase-like hydrolase/transferase [Seonamhaeicola maritimus]|uniref:Sulfatase-like hydrolase/transferase n=1 Tax=Seonamhaeicola maritimus TaxID=2591822 RepID=A0A5C7GDZ7_9FLAO|nr:sulfatase-like hydrolase/transferase [Seonamhaeicola maritimus]TXG35141.1 sulfatase-like hydrolase/transferase [Seonamhaeicola maritimus]
MKLKNLKINVTFSMLFLALNVFAQTANTRPNVIVILADDLGYGDVGFNRDAYNSTYPFPAERGVIPTPNIDALANNGIICTNAHVAHPFCGPSRVGLLTGIMPHRIGAQYNLPNDITTTLGVPTNETYFSNLLQGANYNTAAIGKWHLGFSDGSYQPLDRGFDYFFGMLGGGKNYFESIYEDNFYNRQGGSNPVTNEYQDPLWRDRDYVAESEFSDAVDEDYLTDVLTDEAIAYIAANAPSSDPFFMYLSYNAPHTPLQAPAAEIAQFKLDNPNFESLVNNSDYIKNSNPVTNLPLEDQQAKIDELTDARVTYATMVANMDENIGRVIAELQKDMTEYNNTLIIFLSDNGGYTFSKGAVNWPLDALKGSVKEGGHKVPMFVHWPAQISTPTTYNHQLSSLDLYPTLVNLAGNNLIPIDKTLDGVDFMDDLIAGTDARPDETLVIMRPQNGFHNGGLSSDKWKIVKTSSGQWKLYDILNDPGETTDLRGSEPNAEQIIQDMLDDAIAIVADFKDVKPLWYDNDGNGSGHPHSFLWNDGTLPAYDQLFESPLLLLESEISEISIISVTDAVEGEIDGVFTVSLPEGINAGEDIDVTYIISGDTSNGTDYPTLSGMVTIANGTNSVNINIAAVADGLDETSETLTLTLQTTTVGSVSATPVSIFVLDAIAPTTLTAGDIAIVGFKAEGTNNGTVAFMLLKDISATTKISISNRSWKGTQDGWTGDYSVDDVWTWTAGAAFSSGDIFKLDSDGLVKRVTGDAEVVVGTMSHDHTGKIVESSDGDFDMATGGDGILIYQVDPFVLPTDPNSSSWITGLNTNGGWGTGGGNTFCALPTALTNGVNANAVGTDQDNGIYTGALSGAASQLRASINNSANWSTSETTNYNLWAYNETASSVAGEIGSSGTLGVEDVLSSDLRLYPNPTSNFVNLSFKQSIQKLELELISITGQLIKKVNGTNANRPRIDVSNLPKGTYILRINADDKLTIEKVIKI